MWHFVNSGLNSQKHLLQLMSSMFYMADPSDLLGSEYSEDALTLALSRTCPCFLGLEISLSAHASGRWTMGSEL